MIPGKQIKQKIPSFYFQSFLYRFRSSRSYEAVKILLVKEEVGDDSEIDDIGNVHGSAV